MVGYFSSLGSTPPQRLKTNVFPPDLISYIYCCNTNKLYITQQFVSKIKLMFNCSESDGDGSTQVIEITKVIVGSHLLFPLPDAAGSQVHSLSQRSAQRSQTIQYIIEQQLWSEGRTDIRSFSPDNTSQSYLDLWFRVGPGLRHLTRPHGGPHRVRGHPLVPGPGSHAQCEGNIDPEWSTCAKKTELKGHFLPFRDTLRLWISGVLAASWERWSTIDLCSLANITWIRSARSRKCSALQARTISPSSPTRRPSCTSTVCHWDPPWRGQINIQTPMKGWMLN